MCSGGGGDASAVAFELQQQQPAPPPPQQQQQQQQLQLQLQLHEEPLIDLPLPDSMVLAEVSQRACIWWICARVGRHGDDVQPRCREGEESGEEEEEVSAPEVC
jgi:hypothetical protein